MEKEASLIHFEVLNHLDELEETRNEVDIDEKLLEELLREEEEDIMAILATMDQKDAVEDPVDEAMHDITMSDFDV